MRVQQISENVYAVGVLNSTLRIFDVIMETKFGTTYNSYLIKGEKNILIDAVHEHYCEEFLENIASVVPVEEIDYLIVNHTEPDHTGSIRRLLEKNPKITVVASASGARFLKRMVPNGYPIQVVKDQDTLPIKETIRFINAPFLHWPDSMFTWYEDERLLFTCDFLGAHYCESRYFDTFAKPAFYEEAFAYYYDCIFSPFKSYVLAGLDKIQDLPCRYICPSHGPILTKDLERRIALYRQWSAEAPNARKKLFIPFASAYGYTRQLAERAAAVAEEAGVEAELFDLAGADLSVAATRFHAADAVLIASCTINQDAPKPVWDLLSMVAPITEKGKIVGAIGSYGWSGEAVGLIRDRLTGLKMRFIGEGVRAVFRPAAEDLTATEAYALQMLENL